MSSTPSTRTLTLVVAAALFMESLVSAVTATSLAAMAAMLLDGLRGVAGRSALAAQDIGRAFFTIGLIALLSIAAFRHLAPDAGAEVSGHGRQPDPE